MMYELIAVESVKEEKDDTRLMIRIQGKKLKDMFLDKRIKTAEIRFDDGRMISALQRKKAYATIRDISDYTGYLPEQQKEWLKYLHIERTGADYISLSDCTMDEARGFINTILEYAIEEGIPLSDLAINRTDDIGKYLYYCIKHKKSLIIHDLLTDYLKMKCIFVDLLL